MVDLVSVLAATSLAAAPVYRDAVHVHTVLVEVHVADRRGRFVSGLGPGDFILLEDGEKRSIQSIREVHHARPGAAPPWSSARAVLAPPRHFVFVYDLFMSRPWSLRRAGRAAAEWASSELGPGDRVSVATVGRELRFLVEDRPVSELVLLALERASLLEESLSAGFAPTLPSDLVAGLDARGTARDVGRMAAALEALALRVEERPGPKAVIVVTERLGAAYFTPWQEAIRPSRATFRYHAERVDRRFQAAGAKLHVLLTSGGRPGLEGGVPASVKGREGSSRTGLRRPLRHLCAAGTCEGFPAYVASLTGGNLYRPTDFETALQESTAELEAYYELSFASPQDGEPGSYRRLKVLVRGEDVSVHHKRGYFLPTPYAEMDSAEREAQLLAALGGASAFLDELPVGLRLVPVPTGGGRVWLTLVARLPGSSFTSLGRFQVLGEVRDPLGRPLARVNDLVHLGELGASQRLRDEGLEYVGGLLLPRGLGTLRVVVRDELDGRTAVADLPFDTRSSLAAPVLLEPWSRPLRALGGNAGRPHGLLEFGGWAVHPALEDRVRSDATVSVLLELPKRPRGWTSGLRFALIDSHGRSYRAETRRSRSEPRGERVVLLAEVALPRIEPGDCLLRVTSRTGLASELPLVCE